MSLIDDNAVVVAVAVAFFLIVAPSIGGMGVMQVAIACFNARGKPMPALTISVVRTFVFYVPLCIVGNVLWGYIGIFVATAVTNVVMGVAGWYWNRASVTRFVARQAAAPAGG